MPTILLVHICWLSTPCLCISSMPTILFVHDCILYILFVHTCWLFIYAQDLGCLDHSAAISVGKTRVHFLRTRTRTWTRAFRTRTRTRTREFCLDSDSDSQLLHAFIAVRT